MRLNVRFQEEGSELSEKVAFQENRDQLLRFGFGDFQTQTTSNYNELYNRPYINSVLLQGKLSAADLGLGSVYYDTKENWDRQRNLIAEKAAIYIYSDYQILEDEVGNQTMLAGIKIGDGSSYLIDIPFVSDRTTAAIVEHMANSNMHVSEAEKELWNNKVSAFFIEGDPENLVLSKTEYSTGDSDVVSRP